MGNWRAAADVLRRRALLAGLVLWACALGAGGRALWKYSTSAGPPLRTPASWPAASRLQRAPGQPTLLLFAHPRCPCTRASLAELASLLDEQRGHLAAQVLFLRPAGMAPGWERGELWHKAEQIAGASVQVDEDGREAALFGASTSGHVVLFAAGGELLFSGGITASRGHLGPNAGTSRILSILGGRGADRRESDVYGCPLGDPT
jgi:hypothetical protein